MRCLSRGAFMKALTLLIVLISQLPQVAHATPAMSIRCLAESQKSAIEELRKEAVETNVVPALGLNTMSTKVLSEDSQNRIYRISFLSPQGKENAYEVRMAIESSSCRVTAVQKANL